MAVSNHVLIYSPKRSSRLTYVFNVILKDLLGLQFSLSDNQTEFQNHQGAKFTYSDHPVGNELFFFASRLLFEKGIEDQQLTVFEWKGCPVFYGTHPKYEIPFDLFAASFYLISRYEEYLPHIKDNHLRFSPQQSLAYQKNFLHRPVVNIWAGELKTVLGKHFPELQFTEPEYRFIPTFDIDSAFAYREKGLVRQTGSFAKDLVNLNFQKIGERLKVLSGIESDPFETYDWQLEISRKHHVRHLYFFLVGDYGEYDKNIPLEGSRTFQALIKSIADYADVGIHPSYASNTNKDQLRKEISRLRKVLKREILRSRQHYLKVSFPETYRNLLEFDIAEDYSLGYASEIGFRASICTPFPFYDLDMDTATRLMLFPFAMMDGTMKDYMKLTPKQSISRAKALIDEVKAVNGTLVTLWHNQSVNDKEEWAGWRSVYEEIVSYAVNAGYHNP